MSRSQWSKLTVSHRLSVVDDEVNSETLYTDDVQRKRNRKGIFLAAVGFIIFACCTVATFITCNAAESMQIYAETFNNTLTCHVMMARSLELEHQFVYKYTVINGTVSCPVYERIVEDKEDLLLLERFREEMCQIQAEFEGGGGSGGDITSDLHRRDDGIDCGAEMACFTNPQCDEVFFKQRNSRYSESNHLFMVSASTACIGAVTFIISLLIICFTKKNDDYDKTSKFLKAVNGGVSLDEFTKHEHVVTALSTEKEVPEEIKELICDFADDGGMNRFAETETGWKWEETRSPPHYGEHESP